MNIKKTKRIIRSIEDIVNLQNFLNKMAQEGYQFVGFEMFKMILEESHQRLYYSVVDTKSYMFKDAQDTKDEQNFNDLVDEFGHELVDNDGQFKVYSSKNPIPVYSDMELEIQRVAKRIKVNFISVALYTFFLIYSIYDLLGNGKWIYFKLSSLFILVPVIILIVSQAIELVRQYRFIKGQYTWDSYKFRSIKTDKLTIGQLISMFVLFTSIFLYLVTSAYEAIIYIVFLALLSLFSLRKRKGFEIKLGIVLSVVIAAILGLFISEYSFFGIVENRAEPKTINELNQYELIDYENGDLAQYSWYLKDDLKFYEVFEIKSDCCQEQLIKAYLKKRDMDVGSIMNSTTGIVDRKYGQHNYYREDRFIIVSSEEITEPLIQELQERY